MLRNILSVNILKVSDVLMNTKINASKKAGGSSKNKIPKRRGKARGWKKFDGDYVESGMILYKQLGLNVYPGENVGCGRDATLYALRPGKVMITEETLSPKPDSPLYDPVKNGLVVKKFFFHVLPDEEQHQEFKLVESV